MPQVVSHYFFRHPSSVSLPTGGESDSMVYVTIGIAKGDIDMKIFEM